MVFFGQPFRAHLNRFLKRQRRSRESWQRLTAAVISRVIKPNACCGDGGWERRTGSGAFGTSFGPQARAT